MWHQEGPQLAPDLGLFKEGVLEAAGNQEDSGPFPGHFVVE